MRRGTESWRLLLFLAGAAVFLVPDSARVVGAEAIVDNGDGTYTFTQQIDATSSPPQYEGPWTNESGEYGFGFYSGHDQDFGWLHTFPHAGEPNLLILSATLTIYAWDVDSDVVNGEFDGVTGDGTWLNPQFLQGYDRQDSETAFDLNPGVLYDGELFVYVDIDMLEWPWLTTLDKSILEVRYTYTTNQAPYQPVLARSPAGGVMADDDLVVTPVGPTPADPDGDAVTYSYRWFVDTGTGYYVDADFAGRGKHDGSSVPAQNTEDGDRWLVEVVAVDASGARSNKASIAFPTVGDATVPPIIESVWADPAALWAPNHKMVAVTVHAILSDAIGEATYAVVDVECNVPSGEGDEPDWEITGDHTVLLRAERSGNGEGRVYTVTIVATNGSGVTSTAELLIPVSHDRSARDKSVSGTGNGPKRPGI